MQQTKINKEQIKGTNLSKLKYNGLLMLWHHK